MSLLHWFFKEPPHFSEDSVDMKITERLYQSQIEIDVLKQNIRNNESALRIDTGLRQIARQKRKAFREKIKNPQSIWIRKRALKY